jgi:signal transduction histidine kinase
MSERDSSLSAARSLVWVIASVVFAFLVAAIAAQYLQRAISTRASEIISNAMPSVKLLSAARGDLRKMELGVIHDGTGRASRVAEARHDIEEELSSFRALPYFPDERLIFQHVSDELAKLDGDYAAWRSSPTADGQTTLRTDFANVDAALERAIDFDADQGERLGIEIEHVRANATGAVTLLEAIAVVLALVAAALALRQLRRAARAWRADIDAGERRESELRETNEALGQFAGRIAHDVLSPLATTSLSIDLLRQSCHDDRVAMGAADRGMNALHRVHALVDGLLAFARAGGKPEPGATAELAPVLGEIVDGLRSQADLHGIALSLEPIPVGLANCHRGVLASIVTNLVQNAIKYMNDAREKRITVAISDADTRWHFDVTDTGPGIPQDQQARIFEPYVQLSRGSSGVGLGLATVDRLVRAHGGTVGVRSQPGAGTTFWFELPKARPSARPSGVSTMQPVTA